MCGVCVGECGYGSIGPAGSGTGELGRNWGGEQEADWVSGDSHFPFSFPFLYFLNNVKKTDHLVLGGSLRYDEYNGLDITPLTSTLHMPPMFENVWAGGETSRDVERRGGCGQQRKSAAGQKTSILKHYQKLKQPKVETSGSLVGLGTWGWKPFLEEGEGMQSLPLCWGEDHHLASSVLFCKIWFNFVVHFHFLFYH